MLARNARDLASLLATGRLLVVTAIAAAVVAGIGAVARQQAIPRYRTVWAEDGQLFGGCPMFASSQLDCLFMPYDGWLHLVPRSLGWLAASLPPEWFSYTVTALAAAGLAACAFLVARAVAEATGSRIAGFMSGVALALVAPAGIEVTGNMTNLAWILFIASTTVLTTRLLGRPLGRLDVALIVLTIASSPFGFLLVALLVIDLLASRERGGGSPRLLAVAVALATVQLAMAFVSPRNEIPDLPVTLLSPVAWFVELVFVKGPFGGRGPVPGWLVGVIAASMVLVLAWLGRRAAPRIREAGGSWQAGWWMPSFALLALGGASAALFAASTYLNRHVAPRYEYVPAGAMVIALMIGVALAARAWSPSLTLRARRFGASAIPVALVAVVVAVGFASTFRVRTGASRGPSYPAAFRDAARACDAGASVAVVPISPLPAGSVTATWHLRIPCDRINR